MAHNILVEGISDELLELLDDRVRRGHAASRGDYIRELLRKHLHIDELAALYARTAVLSPPNMSFAEIVAPLQEEVRLKDYTEEEMNTLLNETLAEVRREKRQRKNTDKAAAA